MQAAAALSRAEMQYAARQRDDMAFDRRGSSHPWLDVSDFEYAEVLRWTGAASLALLQLDFRLSCRGAPEKCAFRGQGRSAIEDDASIALVHREKQWSQQHT